MKVGRFLILTILSCHFFVAGAQTLRGVLRDADAGAPIANASIRLQPSQPGLPVISANSAAEGQFEIGPLRAGYYRCDISATGYEALSIFEINMAAGKDQILDIQLVRLATALPDVVIRTTLPTQKPLQPISEILLTKDQTLRFPSMYFDPARLAAAYPGVAQTDDGINGMSIRGNNPGAVRWRLEGVDVVNPNHLPNAGTFNDRPATASGGILMFSAQLLDNSSLLTGAYPAGYGDALGGMMDMNLRKGNTRQHEFTAQAGLIGLDLAAEGPLGKTGQNSYLANYRYSTVGLLGELGVSFGGEQIGFQDLSFKTHFVGKKGGHWSLFGVGGISKNIFSAATDTIEQYKDLFDIRFTSQTGLLGLSYRSILGPKTAFRASIVSSTQQNNRRAEGAGIDDRDENTETRTGLSAVISHKISDQKKISAGLNIQLAQYNGQATRNQLYEYEGRVNLIQAQPWINWDWSSANRRWSARLGVHANSYSTLGELKKGDINLEPRALFSWKINPKHLLALSYGYHSQLNPLWLEADFRPQASDPAQIYPNRGAGFVRAHQIGLRHNWQFRESWVMKTELYWQQQNNLATLVQQSTFSLFNQTELVALNDIRTLGAAENKGIEWSLEKYFNRNWFLAANTSWFQSKYQGDDQIWRVSRWDLGHLANLTLGKEWYRERSSEKTKSFGLNGRVVWTGGFREMPIDVAASAQDKTTRFDTRNGFTIQQPDYFRVDLRVYWKRSLTNRRNSTFAMDFQNVTMQKNIAYRYYDPVTAKVETKYQLGLIPNISWKLEF